MSSSSAHHTMQRSPRSCSGMPVSWPIVIVSNSFKQMFCQYSQNGTSPELVCYSPLKVLVYLFFIRNLQTPRQLRTGRGARLDAGFVSYVEIQEHQAVRLGGLESLQHWVAVRLAGSSSHPVVGAGQQLLHVLQANTPGRSCKQEEASNKAALTPGELWSCVHGWVSNIDFHIPNSGHCLFTEPGGCGFLQV